MRCPRCQAENPGAALYCGACHHRLFAWLGDPFGNLEPQGVATIPAQPATGSAWGKGVIALLFLSPWTISPQMMWGVAVVGFLMVAALWRWPRMGGYAFLALLVGGMIAVPLIGNVASGH